MSVFVLLPLGHRSKKVRPLTKGKIMFTFLSIEQIRNKGYGRESTDDKTLANSYKQKLITQAKKRGDELFGAVLIAGIEYTQDGTVFVAQRTGVLFSKVEGVMPRKVSGRETESVDDALAAGEDWELPISE